VRLGGCLFGGSCLSPYSERHAPDAPLQSSPAKAGEPPDAVVLLLRPGCRGMPVTSDARVMGPGLSSVRLESVRSPSMPVEIILPAWASIPAQMVHEINADDDHHHVGIMPAKNLVSVDVVFGANALQV